MVNVALASIFMGLKQGRDGQSRLPYFWNVPIRRNRWGLIPVQFRNAREKADNSE